MNKKTIISLGASCCLILALVAYPSTAQASQLSVLGVTVTWDDSTLYQPDSCSTYFLDYTAGNGTLFIDASFMNKFGDKLGTGSAYGAGTGRISVQVCGFQDFSGAKLTLDVQQLNAGSIVEQSVSNPVAFLSRMGPLPSSSPTPTVTVTANPLPAPTVTVTAPADTSMEINYSVLLSKYEALKAQVTTINAKLKKICSVKPKPRGC